MSRDKLLVQLKNLGKACGAEQKQIREMQNGIARARGVCLDEKAGELLISYLEDLQALGKMDADEMIGSFRSPWPEMWMESSGRGKDADVVTVAIHVVQNGRTLNVSFWGPGDHSGGAVFIPPLTRIAIDQETRSFQQELSAFGEAAEARRGVYAEYEPEVPVGMEEEVVRAMNLLMIASAMTAVLDASSDILRMPEEVPPSRIWRQRYREAGAPTARSAMSRIDLSTSGLKEYSNRVLGEADPDDNYGSGGVGRRAHHVRGHMFLARNGQMTYRRPHIRGAGEVARTMMAVTASSTKESELQAEIKPPAP